MAVVQKNQRLCIFCSQRGANSKEHFFSAWLPDHIKAWDTNNHTLVRDDYDLLTNAKRRDKKSKPGTLATKKIRCVCQVCNNGWMNRAEGIARPHLEPLLVGKPSILSREAQRAIAHWVAIKTVTSEHSNRETSVTPPEQRKAIMDGQIPEMFQIYLGAHLAQDLGYCRSSHSGAWGKSGDFEKLPLEGRFTKNTQQITFTVGRLFAHVNMTTLENLNLEPVCGFIGFYKIAKIWPIQKNLFVWPPTQPLTHDQLNELATSLSRRISSRIDPIF